MHRLGGYGLLVYCARVLNPGTTTWPEAIPAFLVTVALLFVPGTVAALLARLRLGVALAVGPVLSTSWLALTGIAAPLAGLRWGVVPMIGGLLVLWAAAAMVGLAESRVAPRWSWLRRPNGDEQAAEDRGSRLMGHLDGPMLATVAGVAFAFAVVAYTMVRISHTPEAFPQHPDTIFHLADAQWMLDRGNISSLTAAGYITPAGTGFYPAAFHGFTATIALLTGVPVVVATSVFVLAIAGLVWPLGCIALATTLLGRRTPVVLATGVTCVAFTGYPYFLMGFGVLWPNLFGETLLPGYLATFVALFGGRTLRTSSFAPRLTAAAIVVVGLPGLTLAHPNALMSFGVFALIFLTGRALGWAWRLRGRPLRALAIPIGIALALAAMLAASRTVAPTSMVETGAIGPELPVGAALGDLFYFAPRGAAYLPVLTGVVAIGIIALLVRHRGARWIVASLIFMFGLYWVNVTIDTRSVRTFTWPWYNNAVRLQAVAILPTVVAAAAGLLVVVDLLARLARRAAGAVGSVAIATTLVMAAFVLSTHAYTDAHDEIIDRYFHPPASNSWASDPELRALHTMARSIPDDAVVAANPWNGGTYLYVVSGRHLLIPTEKADAEGDRKMLGLRLDQVSTDREVCAAAKRQKVQWAITGGRPFAWAGENLKNYVGVDGVGRSPGWTRVEKVGPYTLYRLTSCAT